MKNTNRRMLTSAIAAATVVAAAIGLSGCGTDAGDASGKTTITVWHQVTGDSNTQLEALVADYNKSQDKYEVKPQYNTGTDGVITSKLVNAVKNGNGPDLMLSDTSPQFLSQVIATGKVVDLGPLLNDGTSAIQQDNISEGMLSTGTFDGKIYSIPTDAGNYALVYNKKLLAAAGFDSPPTTWDEIRQYSQKLTHDGVYGIYLPIGSDEWPVFTWESMLWSAGGELTSADNTKATFSSPEGVKALSVWTDLIKDGLAYPQSLASPSDGQGINGLAAGKVAMVITGAYNLPTLDKALGAENVGTAVLPAVDRPAMNLGTNNSYILQTTDAKQAGAWDFLQYWLSPKVQSTWDQATGLFPTNKATVESAEYQAFLADNPRLVPFVDELAYAQARPSIAGYSGLSAALGAELEKAMLGQKSPADALADAQVAAQKALDENQ